MVSVKDTLKTGRWLILHAPDYVLKNFSDLRTQKITLETKIKELDKLRFCDRCGQCKGCPCK